MKTASVLRLFCPVSGMFPASPAGAGTAGISGAAVQFNKIIAPGMSGFAIPAGASYRGHANQSNFDSRVEK